jgi:hypothetical protein
VFILHGKQFYNLLNEVLTSGCRSSVHPLVTGVPGSCYTGFRTYEGAFFDYSTAKEEGKVRSVREPGDEYLFGPVSRACM